jgi:hypothetical protein
MFWNLALNVDPEIYVIFCSKSETYVIDYCTVQSLNIVIFVVIKYSSKVLCACGLNKIDEETKTEI